MSDPILQDLRTVSDEMLYTRLLILRQRFPKDSAAEDWIYRCGTWEMANNAVHAEIRRRKAKPPPWLTTAAPVPKQRRAALIAGCVLTALPMFGVLGLLASR